MFNSGHSGPGFFLEAFRSFLSLKISFFFKIIYNLGGQDKISLFIGGPLPMKKISRRSFFNTSLGLGAGALISRAYSFSQTSKTGQIPMLVTSHTNATGKKAAELGWEILSKGGTALDAVEKAANIIELDAEGTSVGYGGLPNEEGVVQLDASIMDGKTYNAGSVACLENIKTPCSVARIVMEKTDHVMLVGKDALHFAKLWGFKEEDLLTEKARGIWLRWKMQMSDRDDWGPAEHLKDLVSSEDFGEDEYTTGTTNVLAVDKNGDITGITTTSGLSFKIPGRVGDSPIIGAGLYVDNEVGAAGATGRGEDVIKCCASFYMVMRMKEGRTPQQACEDALKLIVENYKKVNPDFFPGEQFVAINKKGELGCSRMSGRSPASMSVMDAGGYRIHQGTVAFPTD
jgi:N4-(beta-N-acetylglucosaminyl)-L-asparaginase